MDKPKTIGDLIRAQMEGQKPPTELHLMTQNGQPYGSGRKCCENCGKMMVHGKTTWAVTNHAFASILQNGHAGVKYVRCTI